MGEWEIEAVKRIRSSRSSRGFSLLELLLAMALGVTLFGVILQALLAEGQTRDQLMRLLREKAFQHRTFDLVQSDLRRATAISERPELAEAACNLGGRKALLHLKTPAGPITYSSGRAPSDIWRGDVLMRCGPAYGLDGALNPSGVMLNRVVIDGLMATDSEPFEAQLDVASRSLHLRLQQGFVQGVRVQMIRGGRYLDLMGLVLT